MINSLTECKSERFYLVEVILEQQDSQEKVKIQVEIEKKDKTLEWMGSANSPSEE